MSKVCSLSSNLRKGFTLVEIIIALVLSAIALFGIGIGLINKFIKIGDEWENDVSKHHQQELEKALNRGALVASFPDTVDVKKGGEYFFSVGISNELGDNQDFYTFIKLDTSLPGDNPKTQYIKGPYAIRNNES